MTITRDGMAVSRWMAERLGADYLMPCEGGVGQVVDGQMVAGLIWYSRDDKSVWAHLVVDVPTPAFLREAIAAPFEAADEVHFLAHEDHAPLRRLAQRLGAESVPPDDSRSGQGWTQYRLRRPARI